MNWNINGIFHPSLEITALQLLGSILGIFSMSPPPVIWAKPFMVNLSRRAFMVFTYIFVGVRSSLPRLLLSPVILLLGFNFSLSKSTFLAKRIPWLARPLMGGRFTF